MKRKHARPQSPAGTGGSASDILTSLIGVMMMILIGILLTSVIGHATLEMTAARPVDLDTSPGESLGYAESRAFPHFPGGKRAVYLDVSADRVEILRGSDAPEVVPAGELALPSNAVSRRLDDVALHPEDEYVVLLIHPGAARLGRGLRDQVRARGLDVGVDLLLSGQSPVPPRRRAALSPSRHPFAPPA